MSFATLAEVWRGPVMESVHQGVATVANANGEIVAGWGDHAFQTFPRSSLKPFQAMALVETGAADRLGLTLQHLALACASHRAEAFQVALVEAWLQALGLGEADLACGPAYPRDEADMKQMIREGVLPTRLHHNCSGKHCGLLSVCLDKGFESGGYNQPEHPVQQHVFDVISDFTEHDVGAGPLAVDGCTLPAPALTMAQMARATARFAAGRRGSAIRRDASRRLVDAMAAKPDHVSGADQPTSQIARATAGRVLVKGGAEAFLVAFLPRDELGIAIKVADGQSRARLPALMAVLDELGVLDERSRDALAALRQPPVLNSTGTVVGTIRPALGRGPHRHGGAETVEPRVA